MKKIIFLFGFVFLLSSCKEIKSPIPTDGVIVEADDGNQSVTPAETAPPATVEPAETPPIESPALSVAKKEVSAFIREYLSIKQFDDGENENITEQLKNMYFNSDDYESINVRGNLYDVMYADSDRPDTVLKIEVVADEYDDIVYSAIAYVTFNDDSPELLEQMKFQLIKEDTWKIIGIDTNVFIDYVDSIPDKFMEGFDSASVFVEDEQGENVFIWTDRALESVSVVALDYVDLGDGYKFYEQNELYKTDEVSIKTPLIIKTIIPETIPKTGIKVIYKNGQEQSFIISWSGMDGSVRLSQNKFEKQ